MVTMIAATFTNCASDEPQIKQREVEQQVQEVVNKKKPALKEALKVRERDFK